MTHRRAGCLVLGLLAGMSALTLEVHAQQVRLEVTGRPQVLFDSARDGCDGVDVPDVNPRAFRDDKGQIVFFALHYINRAMRGPDLAHLKLDCRIVVTSNFDPEPAHYNDRSFVTATWTANGRDVTALIHHEYHADQHGRCTAKSDLACWYNSILAYRSSNGGASFEKDRPLVVASAPFGQEFEQGRHRGFFNPSNIFSDGKYEYFFAATTGWQGQPYGACLFRSERPGDSASWRAYDGHAFSIHYADPYIAKSAAPKPCEPIAPFVFPVGGVVHDRKSDLWIAVFQATRDGQNFPVDGFYYATSTNLLQWSDAKLLLAGKTLFSDLCTAGSSVIAYPALLDEHAENRNFDAVADDTHLYYTMITVDHCSTGRRLLVRAKVTISVDAARQP